jgi:tRNA(Ile)-lysidine synthase
MPMTALAARVLSDLRRLRLVRVDDRVVVALSGGPDSVALALLMAEALAAVPARLVGLAHLHHGLRGGDADADVAFCGELAASLGLPLQVERADAAAFARAHRVSLEVAGHRLRHAFYVRARKALGARIVATGHTRNDLAETFLMRAVRGAGLRGLAGIRSMRPGLIRPLLDVSRQEVLQYLEERGRTFREDASNRDTRIPRNRIRHELLPWLERHLSPKAVEALARTARLAAADEEHLDRLATGAWPLVVLSVDAAIELDLAAFRLQPRALQRRLVFMGLDRLGGRPVTAKVVEAALDLAADDAAAGVVEIGGFGIEGREGRLILRAGHRRPPHAPRCLDGALVGELDVPGTLALPGGGSIEAAVLDRDGGDGREPVEGDRARLDAGAIRRPLRVRFRRHGDRLRPLGMRGRKKLQDVFVDRHVPRRERDRVPLVVDAEERIIWVAGHVVADDARVTSATTSVLLLKYWR